MIISIFIDQYSICIKTKFICVYKFGLNYNLNASRDMRYEHENSRITDQTI
jgi:hypothetical protein